VFNGLEKGSAALQFWRQADVGAVQRAKQEKAAAETMGHMHVAMLSHMTLLQ